MSQMTTFDDKDKTIHVIQKASPNQSSRNGYKPDMIVNHITAGETASSALNWFANPEVEVSAHFVIDKDGSIYECVPIECCAWANGTSTTSKDARYYGKSSLTLVRNRKTNTNYYTISIEHVNAGGGKLTEPQLTASIQLHKYIIAEVKRLYGVTIPVDREHIVGHSEVTPQWKPNCPGKEFPYQTILNGIKGNDSVVMSDTTCDIQIKRGSFYTAKFSGADVISVVAGTGGVVTIVPINRGADKLAAIVSIGKQGDATGIYTQAAGEDPKHQFNVRIV